ncbi:MAG: DUF1064 domain-containing protein [Pyrinomonadaceae bacterium]|nr:DUF1064 domain-containing protein [Pyrinomonadaceae bacterium]
MPTTTKPKKRNKYGAIPTVVDGIRFHSKLEAARYRELSARLALGRITNLDRQISFPVHWPGMVENKTSLFFTYVADFTYINDDGQSIVEDVKGKVLGEFRLKSKGVKFALDVDVAIVTRKRVNGRLRWHFNKVPEPKEYLGSP